jgi:importin subunit alpha-6/7
MFRNDAASVQHAALITIGNIVTGDDEQTQVLINHGVLPLLRRLLSHSKKSILKDSCFTISNIAAGSKHQIQVSITHVERR